MAASAFVAVFIGAGLGGALRHAVNLFATKLFGATFPVHTLAVNVLGCFAMGVAAACFARFAGPGQTWRLFLTTGVLGGFTTFSAFSLETALLVERGTPLVATVYVLLSVAGSVAALFLGLLVVRLIL
jgi:fluoride exporter